MSVDQTPVHAAAGLNFKSVMANNCAWKQLSKNAQIRRNPYVAEETDSIDLPAKVFGATLTIQDLPA